MSFFKKAARRIKSGIKKAYNSGLAKVVLQSVPVPGVAGLANFLPEPKKGSSSKKGASRTVEAMQTGVVKKSNVKSQNKNNMNEQEEKKDFVKQMKEFFEKNWKTIALAGGAAAAAYLLTPKKKVRRRR